MPASLKAYAPKTTPPVDKAVNYTPFTLCSSLLGQQVGQFWGLVPLKSLNFTGIMVFGTFSIVKGCLYCENIKKTTTQESVIYTQHAFYCTVIVANLHIIETHFEYFLSFSRKQKLLLKLLL